MNGLNNNLTNYKAICRDCRIHVGECLENIVWVFFCRQTWAGVGDECYW